MAGNPNLLLNFLSQIAGNPNYFRPVAKGSAGAQAAAATNLSYGPQAAALAMLLQQAKYGHDTGVQSARRSGMFGAQGIGAIRDSYLSGLKDTLGNVGGPVSGVAGTPEQKAAQNLGLSGTALAGMLSSMAGQQIAGIGNQHAQLDRSYNMDQSMTGQKLVQLLAQAGAYNTQQYNALNLTNRRLQIPLEVAKQRTAAMLASHGLDAQGNPNANFPKLHPAKQPAVNQYGRTAAQWAALTDPQRQAIIKSYKNNTSSGKGSNGGKGPSSAFTTFRKEYGTAVTYARTLNAHGTFTAAELADTLTKGVPSQTVNGVRTPALKALDPLAAKAAAQHILYGGVYGALYGQIHQNYGNPARLGIKRLPQGYKPPRTAAQVGAGLANSGVQQAAGQG